MTECLMVCPECGTELETTQMEESENGMLQALEQDCPDCSYTTEIAILNYPDESFEVIGPGEESDWVLERTGGTVRHEPDERIRAHQRRAIEFRDEL